MYTEDMLNAMKPGTIFRIKDDTIIVKMHPNEWFGIFTENGDYARIQSYGFMMARIPCKRYTMKQLLNLKTLELIYQGK